ncbi:MAG: hypothetical protein WC829_00800 [Hyphomicrobium sp.]
MGNNIARQGMGLPFPNVRAEHHLTWCVRAVETIVVDKGQLRDAHSRQTHTNPAAKTTCPSDHHMRGLKPPLIVPGHRRLSAEQVGLGAVARGWESRCL